MDSYFLYSGYIGSVLLCMSFVPQVYKVFKTKNVESLSSGFIILQIITCLFLTTYGMGFILVNDINGVPIIIANGWILGCSILLGVAKLKYKNIKKNDNGSHYVKSPSRDKKKIESHF